MEIYLKKEEYNDFNNKDENKFWFLDPKKEEGTSRVALSISHCNALSERQEVFLKLF